MVIPSTLHGLLAQIDAIDDLLTILRSHTSPGPIWRISVPPWALFHLQLRRIEVIHMVCGDTDVDEQGQQTNSDGTYLYTRDSMVAVGIELEQKAAYRLWDRIGRELTGDRRGWYYVVSNSSRESESGRCEDDA